MSDLLGIPPADLPALQRLGQDVLLSYDLDWDGRPAMGAALAMLPRLFQPTTGARAGYAPCAPAARSPVRPRPADESLSDTCSKLFVAGTTTTAGCISNILARLLGGSADTAFDTASLRGVPVTPEMLDRLLRFRHACAGPEARGPLGDCAGGCDPCAGAEGRPAGGLRQPRPDPDGQRPLQSLTFGLGIIIAWER